MSQLAQGIFKLRIEEHKKVGLTECRPEYRIVGKMAGFTGASQSHL